jgi:hypothetical protein
LVAVALPVGQQQTVQTAIIRFFLQLLPRVVAAAQLKATLLIRPEQVLVVLAVLAVVLPTTLQLHQTRQVDQEPQGKATKAVTVAMLEAALVVAVLARRELKPMQTLSLHPTTEKPGGTAQPRLLLELL